MLTNQVLGRGQYGVVQYAFNRDDPADVYAVKVIERAKIQRDAELRNLQNEIAIMAEINSPNVVALKDATKTAGNYYLAMELCNGGDLDNFRRQRGGHLVEQETRIILRQVIRGVAAIKAQNVMHRDLKLPNVMLHFSDLRNNVIVDTHFNLNEYIKEFDFEKLHKSITCKIADLGFARKLQED